MKRKLLSVFALATLSLSTNIVFALENQYCDGSKENPCIVQDTDKDTSKIKHWRTAKMMAQAYKGNTTGLKDMWVSGSGATSAKGFKEIAKKIDDETKGKVKKIIDLDLREESHSYLNKNALTLTDMDNWINNGKTYQQSLADEQSWIQLVSSQTRVENILTPDEFKDGKFSQGANVDIVLLQSEQEVAEKAGFEYHRLAVSDHMAPRADDVDRFVTLVSNLPSRSWLHIHCRGGDGRSTTFMVMYDMLLNADKVSFNDIIRRQASVDPNYDLSDVDGKNPKYSQLYADRYKFIMHFYQFANERLQGYKGNWSDWTKQNPIN